MIAGRIIFIGQDFDYLTQDIENFQFYMSAKRKAEGYRCVRVEGIGVILIQRKDIGQNIADIVIDSRPAVD